MAFKWLKTNYPGLRYRQHPTKKHGLKPDRFYQFRHRAEGKILEESFGWLSDGWTEEVCIAEIAEIKHSKKTGKGPVTLKDKRELESLKKQQEVIKLKEKQAELERQEQEQRTFSDIWDQYYESDASKKPNTWRSEKVLYNGWIKPVIGSKPLKKIQKMDLQRVKKKMAGANRADRTIEYALSVIRQVFNFAQDNGLYVGAMPKIDRRKSKLVPRFDNKRKRYLKPDEAEKLFKALWTRSVDMHDLTLLCYYTGLRWGEAAALRWGDVDIEQGIIHVLDTKGKVDRVAYLTDSVQAMFKRRMPGSQDDLIFPARGGGVRKSPSHTFDRTVDELGFNKGITDPKHKLTFHSVRHGFGSALVQKGVSLYVVKELMGHSDIRLTERYSHLDDEAMKSAVMTLEPERKKKKGNVIPIAKNG